MLAAGPTSSNAVFQFSLPQATDGVAAAAAGSLDGLNLITRKDAFGRSASQASGNQVAGTTLHCLVQALRGTRIA